MKPYWQWGRVGVNAHWSLGRTIEFKFFSLILDSSFGLAAGIQSASSRGPGFESCIQQRKTTALISILYHFSVASAWKWTPTNTNSLIYTYTHIHKHIYIYINIHTHTLTHTYMYTHTHTHTHTTDNMTNDEISSGESFLSEFPQTKLMYNYFDIWEYWSVLDLHSSYQSYL